MPGHDQRQDDTATGAPTLRDAHAASIGDARNDGPQQHLFRDCSFWGMVATQFLGAFNDNLFKQLMLLIAVSASIASGSLDQQGLATVVFSLPFILFSGFAGFLSDRYSKRPIIIAAKVAEIVVMALGVLAFVTYSRFGYQGLLVVLFLMGTQSAFFGPGKYGILPEMLRPEHLPRANGVMLMTTFLAIIFGTASAGALKAALMDGGAVEVAGASNLWMGCTLCVGIAVLGTCTAFLIGRVSPAKADLRFRWSALAIPPETRRLLWEDRPLLDAIFASCIFWLVSGIAIQAVNYFGLDQLALDDFWTSILTATIGVGISVGAVLAGRLCHGQADASVVRKGAWGLFVFLIVISISRQDGTHLLGFYGSLVGLALLGMSAGLFAIPVQVFIQSRPPAEQKGRMIAVMNQTNFVAILCSGIVYTLFDRLVVRFDWPRSYIFAMMALIILPVAIFYRLPDDASPVTTKDATREKE